MRPLPRAVVWSLSLALVALFAWNIARTWFLGDDAFISFRYADNLAAGQGLSWNPGERVEGYTNFLWVLLLAAGMRLGLEPELLSNVLGVTCGLLLLLSVLRFAARGRSLSSPVPWLLAAVLAASRSFSAWCTGGLETMLFALLVFAGFVRFFRPWHGARDALPCSLYFSAAALTRPEGVLFTVLALALLGLDVLASRRTARAALVYLACGLLVIGAHFLWRRSYYGEWLPNTFYAKVPGAWFPQGWRYLAYYHDAYRIGWFLPLALVALLGPQRRIAASFLFVLGVYVVYVLYAGGDLFELRFWVHVFPLLYWLVVEGIAVLALRWRRATPALPALAALSLLYTTYRGFERVPANLYGLQSVTGIDHYTSGRMEEGRFLRAQIDRGALPRELVLGVGGAGAVPYYTGWTTVDRRGLNDALIARLAVEDRGLVGHERDAPYDYLVERRVAVFDYFNQLLVKPQGLRQLKGPYYHEGRRLDMCAIPLGERVLVFATFLSEADAATVFADVTLLRLNG